MLTPTNSWTPYVVGTALTVSVLSVIIWNKRRKNYVRVGSISRLFFYPVKSLKAVEVSKGKCTKLGFEVDGILDRSFMLINENGVLVSQRDCPSLALLTPHINGNFLIINGPNREALKIEIKKSQSPGDKRISCRVHADIVDGVDCGDEAASWFQSYLNTEGVRLVRYFSTGTVRKYIKDNPFFSKMRKAYQIGFQDAGAFHVVSQASVDDINSKQKEKEITALNFRPNIVVEGCEAFAEDSWKYIKFDSGPELLNLILTTRCLMTTNDPERGVLDQREPLVSLRKYRIVDDPKIAKVTGSVPCFGTTCAVVSSGDIEVGNEIFAVVEKRIKMKVKGT